jgi:hypothetical protein
MTKYILWNHKDVIEGSMSWMEWSYCKKRGCNHVGHARSFSFPITVIKGERLWEGDFGESLVRSSETGRLFFTKYYDLGPWRPVVFTHEIADGTLPDKVVKNLEFLYGSMQHSKVASLVDVLKQNGGATKWLK